MVLLASLKSGEDALAIDGPVDAKRDRYAIDTHTRVSLTSTKSRMHVPDQKGLRRDLPGMPVELKA